MLRLSGATVSLQLEVSIDRPNLLHLPTISITFNSRSFLLQQSSNKSRGERVNCFNCFSFFMP